MINDQPGVYLTGQLLKDQKYRSSLRVSDFVASCLEVSVTLVKVYNLIIQQSRQVPVSHLGEEHRIEFLRRAVIGDR